jgi:NAD-dependent SIR2 family protein deacetylase
MLLRLRFCTRRHLSSKSLFVPSPPSLTSTTSSTSTFIKDADLLSTFLQKHSPSIAVLTGAGISTSAGIPCYRGELGSYSKGHEPVQHNEFLHDPDKRKRFWARSLRGYEYFSKRQPTTTHQLLAQLEENQSIQGIITQNVDRLHHQAGSKHVVELHGRGDTVGCVEDNCTFSEPRKDFTLRMKELNEKWLMKHNLKQKITNIDNDGEDIRADGDAHLSLDDFSDFIVPSCPKCHDGILMPELTFFGGSIANEVKDNATKIINDANALLILGTSASTYSAFRLVRLASKDEKPIFMVNIGETRVDDMVDVKLEWVVDEMMKKAISC